MNWSWQTFVLAMAHSLWQSAIAAAALWMLLRILPASRASLRYFAAVAAMASCLLAAMATWSVLDAKAPASTPRAAASSVAEVVDSPVTPGASATRATEISPAASVGKSPFPWSTLLGETWLAGAAVMLLRLGAGIASAGRLVRLGRPAGPGPLADAVADIADKLRLHRPIRILLHDHWPIPAVVGLLCPALLLPASLATDCPAWQLQIILAHELAHIRRFDFLLNICQQVIEAVLFFNPAIWWITHQIRIEREACCDATAVRLTGSPQQAAETLAEFGSRLFSPTAAMALAGRSRGGGQLLGRVRRIIFPHNRPWISAPWYGAAIAIVAAIMVLAGLRVGTDKAVAVVQNMLISPQDIAKIAAVQQSMPIEQNPAVPLPCNVALHGTVRAADGSPLPRGCHIDVSVEDARGGTGYTFDVGPDGNFSEKIVAGEVHLYVTVPGYALTFSGPLLPDKAGRLPALHLVADRGFAGRIAIVDPTGKPIPNAAVDVNYVDGDINGSYLMADPRHGRAGDDGIFRIDHATSTALLQVGITAPGYEFAHQSIRLSKDGPAIIHLDPAKPTFGAICDSATGAGLPGATVALVACRGGVDISNFDDSSDPPIIATAGPDGRFTLDTLRRDCQYVLAIAAPGHATVLLHGIVAGQAGVRWKLGPPRIIRGRITGDLAKLTRAPRPAIVANFWVDMLGENWGQQRWVPVRIQGKVGTFELRNPIADGVEFDPPDGQRIPVDFNQIPPSIDIKLRAKPVGGKRKVIFIFDLPAGGASPSGALRVQPYDATLDSWPDVPNAPVISGNAEAEVPAPGRVSYRGDGTLVGYWVADAPPVEVAPGKEPLIIHIPAIPAGALSGSVVEPDGSGCANFSLSTIDLVRSRLQGNLDASRQSFEGRPPSNGAFLITPLPLGGTYRFLAESGDRIVITDPIAFTSAHPLVHATLRFLPGVSVPVKILDAGGHPRGSVELRLSFDTKPSNGFGFISHRTAPDGTATFEHVNPNADGTYSVTIPPGNDYPGQQVPIRIDGRSITISLARGLSLSGRVIDGTSGLPIAQVVVRAWPAYDPSAPADRLDCQATTDNEGRFAFHNLDKWRYDMMVEDANPAPSPGMSSADWPTAIGGGPDVVIRAIRQRQ